MALFTIGIVPNERSYRHFVSNGARRAGAATSCCRWCMPSYAGWRPTSCRKKNLGIRCSATALVHDAYLRLFGDLRKSDRDQHHWDNRGHFFSAAAEAMRRILLKAPGGRSG